MVLSILLFHSPYKMAGVYGVLRTLQRQQRDSYNILLRLPGLLSSSSANPGRLLSVRCWPSVNYLAVVDYNVDKVIICINVVIHVYFLFMRELLFIWILYGKFRYDLCFILRKPFNVYLYPVI